MARVLIGLKGKPRSYYVPDVSKDYHCAEGSLSVESLNSANGTEIATNTGRPFVVFDSCFVDDYKKISRAPQIIPKKDVGLVLVECGLTKDSVLVEAGVGSGGFGSIAASLLGKVVSYEIREDHIEVASKNKVKLGLDNWEIKSGDICTAIDEKEVDCVLLDMGNPWDAVDTSYGALKHGGFLVSYSPMIPQVMDFVEKVFSHGGFRIEKVVRVMEEAWEVKERKVRPQSGSIMHSGFLVFARKIK